MKALQRLGNRLHTLGQLVRHFARQHFLLLVPLLLVLFLAGLLLMATTGVSYVMPFVYTLF